MAFSAEKANQYRVRAGAFGSDDSEGNNGLFKIPVKFGCSRRFVNVIISDGLDWEHVSVSMPDKTPSWDTMCKIKDMFWGEDDVVMQLHPKKSDYINHHKHCLHLWRPIDKEIPTPPKKLVGI